MSDGGNPVTGDEQKRQVARLVAARIRDTLPSTAFTGTGTRLGGGDTGATEGARAYLERQKPATVRQPSAAGTELEQSLSARRQAQTEYLSTPEARQAVSRGLANANKIREPSAAGTELETSIKGWRAAKDSYLSSPEAREAVRRSFGEPEPAPVVPPVVDAAVVAAPVFDGAAAAALAAAHPPELTDGDVRAWLSRIAHALEGTGFDYSPEHYGLAKVPFDAVKSNAERAAAAAAREATAAAAAARRDEEGNTARRKADLRAGNTNWTINPVEYFNGITEDQVTEASDGATILASLLQPGLKANGARGNRIACKVNSRHHIHLAGGSWGLAFIYIVEEDFTVTPYVYDLAKSRTADNQYKWTQGTNYNSPAPVPPSHPYQ